MPEIIQTVSQTLSTNKLSVTEDSHERECVKNVICAYLSIIFQNNFLVRLKRVSGMGDACSYAFKFVCSLCQNGNTSSCTITAVKHLELALTRVIPFEEWFRTASVTDK